MCLSEWSREVFSLKSKCGIKSLPYCKEILQYPATMWVSWRYCQTWGTGESMKHTALLPSVFQSYLLAVFDWNKVLVPWKMKRSWPKGSWVLCDPIPMKMWTNVYSLQIERNNRWWYILRRYFLFWKSIQVMEFKRQGRRGKQKNKHSWKMEVT